MLRGIISEGLYIAAFAWLTVSVLYLITVIGYGLYRIIYRGR